MLCHLSKGIYACNVVPLTEMDAATLSQQPPLTTDCPYSLSSENRRKKDGEEREEGRKKEEGEGEDGEKEKRMRMSEERERFSGNYGFEVKRGAVKGGGFEDDKSNSLSLFFFRCDWSFNLILVRNKDSSSSFNRWGLSSQERGDASQKQKVKERFERRPPPPSSFKQSDCWFCIGNENTQDHLIASVGTVRSPLFSSSPFLLVLL